MTSVWGENTEYFYELTPDVIENAIESLGLKTNGRVFGLNSLENRVYQVGLEDPLNVDSSLSQDSVVVKFYRPGRWTFEAIKEEHQFLAELNSLEIPVICPLEFGDETLFQETNTKLFFTIFPRVIGRLKDELDQSEREQMGRLIARIHNVSQTSKFKHRPIFTPDNYLKSHLPVLQDSSVVPNSIKTHYISMCESLYALIHPYFLNLESTRIHGDFHRGNILWSADGPWITDLDDCSMGPPEQDLWLLLPGRDQQSISEREDFLNGYNQISNKERHLKKFLVESLRAIRMVHFNGWIERRWEDPTFKNYYAHYDSLGYWESQLLDIKEQLGLIQESLYE